jgi:hypothetical protein
MNMEYKKYSICETLEQSITNINIISSNMIEDGSLEAGEMWSEPIPFTGKFDLGEEVKHVTGKYFFPNPESKYMTGTSCTEQTDDNPNQTRVEYYKIYELMNEDNHAKFRDWTKAPHSLDYKTGLKQKLQAELTFDSLGNITQVIYYLNATPNPIGLTYTDPILKYNAVYFYNENDGYVTHRTVTRSWMMTDDTWSNDTKVTTKYYTKVQARNVGLRRRRSLIDNLVIEVGFFVMITEGIQSVRDAELIAKPFLDEVSPTLSSYYESGNMRDSTTGSFPLYSVVANSIHTWLDNTIPTQYTGIPNLTIRNFILGRIDVSPLD